MRRRSSWLTVLSTYSLAFFIWANRMSRMVASVWTVEKRKRINIANFCVIFANHMKKRNKLTAQSTARKHNATMTLLMIVLSERIARSDSKNRLIDKRIIICLFITRYFNRDMREGGFNAISCSNWIWYIAFISQLLDFISQVVRLYPIEEREIEIEIKIKIHLCEDKPSRLLSLWKFSRNTCAIRGIVERDEYSHAFLISCIFLFRHYITLKLTINN